MRTLVVVCGLAGLALLAKSAAAVPAAQTCAPCPVVATTDLNLRAGASLDSAVILVIPVGTTIERAGSWEANGFAPVTYQGYQGWAAVEFLASPDAAGAAPGATPVEAAQAAPATGEQRVTLVDLALRAGPAEDAEVLAVLPVGTVVTLTREGDENGYVTADYAGTRGWVYADLIGPVA